LRSNKASSQTPAATVVVWSYKITLTSVLKKTHTPQNGQSAAAAAAAAAVVVVAAAAAAVAAAAAAVVVAAAAAAAAVATSAARGCCCCCCRCCQCCCATAAAVGRFFFCSTPRTLQRTCTHLHAISCLASSCASQRQCLTLPPLSSPPPPTCLCPSIQTTTTTSNYCPSPLGRAPEPPVALALAVAPAAPAMPRRRSAAPCCRSPPSPLSHNRNPLQFRCSG
jgi:hypothetical protein